MPRKSESGRVLLDQASRASLHEMLEELRENEKFLKLTPSRLVCWIVDHYARTLFKKDKALIIQSHFDSKEYLKKAISGSSSEEELAKALETVLKKVRIEKMQSASLKKAKLEKLDTTNEGLEEGSQKPEEAI